MLCDRCQEFCRDTLAGKLEGKRWHSTPFSTRKRIFVHGSAEQAKQNAASGCGLCSLFYDRHMDLVIKHGFNGSEISPSVSMNTGEHILAGRPYQISFQGPYGPEQSVFEFCFDSSEQNRSDVVTNTDFILGKDVEQHIGTSPKDYSGSSSISTLTTLWSWKCRTEHALCQGRNNAKPLPLRVIDVGDNSDGTWSHPRLRTTGGQYGSYATLSYRWSEIGTQFCTTKENINGLKEIIPIQKLPKTIQDAIIFCRSMGYRYLWVDSLCII